VGTLRWRDNRGSLPNWLVTGFWLSTDGGPRLQSYLSLGTTTAINHYHHIDLGVTTLSYDFSSSSHASGWRPVLVHREMRAAKCT
jgi:hypothetical protein